MTNNFLNTKENKFHAIIDIVVRCCRMSEQSQEEVKQKVLSSCREEEIIATRCMLARLLGYAGFTNKTIGVVLHRSPQSIRHLLDLARDFRNQNKIYRKSEAEAFALFQEWEKDN